MKDMGSYGETEVLWPRSDAVSPRVADVIDRVMSAGNDIKTERPHPFYPQSSVHSSPLPKEQDFKNFPHLNSTFNDSFKSGYQDQSKPADDSNNPSDQDQGPPSPAYSDSESYSQSPEFDNSSPQKSYQYEDRPQSERRYSYGEKTPEKSSYPPTSESSPTRKYPYQGIKTENQDHSQSFTETPESSPLKRYHSQDRQDTSSPDTPYHSDKSKFGLDGPFHFGLPGGYPRDPLMHLKESIPSSFPLPPIPQLNISPGSAGQGAFPNGEKGGAAYKYFCHLCSYAGDSKEEFDQHMTIHFEYSCPNCDYTSRTEGRLKRHIKDFHTEDNDGNGKQRTMPGRPKVYRCKQCDYVATVKTEFWQHSRTHIKEDKILQCPRCPFVTEYKHHLEYHLRNHFGSKPFKCNKCNYSCVNKSMLNSHMKSHTNVYQYRCADCTYATKYCHSLKLHLRKYNHKPATVLNTDGSLPQGLDADLSGLSLLAKRGPPRGPRGSKREDTEYMNNMFPFQRPGMLGMPGLPALPPGMNGAMMSPYWPIMSGWNPHLALGANGMHPMGLQNRMLEGGPAKCNLCGFIADNSEKLNAHLMKVHASENQDLFNAYGISSDSANEEAHRPNGVKKREGSPDRPASHGDMLHVRTDTNGENCKPSPHSWPEDTPKHHTSSTNTLSCRSLPDLYANGTGRDKERKEQTDILREMTLKFGSGITPPDMDKEGALDLSKPRPESPSASYLPHKRPYPENDMSSSAENSVNGEISTPNPRKRSRKGKAYKLDTLCLKLQEEKSPYESESDESNGDAGAELASDARGSQHVNPTGDGGESDGSNPVQTDEKNYEGHNGTSQEINVDGHKSMSEFDKIQANLKFLNGQNDEHTTNGENGIGEDPAQQDSPMDLLNSVYENRKKPMSSALRRGAEVAWKILTDPITGEKSQMNGEPIDLPPSPTPSRKNSTSTPSPTVKRHMKEFPFTRAASYECTFCDIAFRDCVMYTMHMGYHGYQNPYKCNMCGNISPDKVEFFLHIARAAHN